MFAENSEQWVSEAFSQAKLGDIKRLVVFASNLSSKLGQSLAQSSTYPADIEAVYRFTRNKAINAQAIAELGFLATAKRVKQYDCLLALEDTTSLEFRHRTVRDKMSTRLQTSIRVVCSLIQYCCLHSSSNMWLVSLSKNDGHERLLYMARIIVMRAEYIRS